MAIKLIALDLDGTTLTDDKHISPATREALEEAAERGVNVVIATGRTFSALPDEVFTVEGIRYVMTSNGAVITDIRENKVIYENYIAPHAVENIVELMAQHDFMVETFVGGIAYIDRKFYDGIRDRKIGYRHMEYVLTTRKPVDDLLQFILDNKERIENVNVNFEYQEDRQMMREKMLQIPDTTLTTAFDTNLEMGGATTSKARALLHLEEILGVKPEEMMAVGDSPNDMAMMKLAGLPVAMGNAKDEVKAIAAFVTDTNKNDGVAKAVRKFVLD